MNSDEEFDQTELGSVKKERSTSKGAITRLIRAVDKIEKKEENIVEIKEKLDGLPKVIEQFENVHKRYLTLLGDDGEKLKEAATYRAAILTEAEEFEAAIQMWLAEEEENPVEEHAIESLQDENIRMAKELEEINKAAEIEHQNHRLKIETERAQSELKSLKMKNQIMFEKERLNFLEEQKKLEDELKSVSERSLELSKIVSNVSVDKNVNMVTSNKSDEKVVRKQNIIEPSVSTPKSITRQYRRLSWDSSSVKDESVRMKTVVSEIMDESRIQQQAIVDALQLPRREMQTFDGNPMKYWSFMRSFQTNIDNKKVDASSKLSCLLHYCKGTARKVIECTEMMPPETGYKRALEILESRFGDSFKITQKWISQVTQRPNVKGPKELREYADELKCCYEMLKTMGHLGDLENPLSMQTIWKKLPQYLQDRWSRENYRKRKSKTKVGLLELVDFVNEAAEEATDPIFSRVTLDYHRTKDSKQNSVENKRNANSNATHQSVAKSGKCPCCDGNHYITKCPSFKTMRIKDRRDLVMKKGLCINCFASGHLGKDCPRNFKCNIDNCGLKHNRFLHFPKPATQQQQQQSTLSAPEPIAQAINPTVNNRINSIPSTLSSVAQTFVPQNPPTEPLSQQPTGQSSYFVGHGHGGKIAMPIVPARIRYPGSHDFKTTYALLDPGSNSSYCSLSLCKQLGVKEKTQQIEITTLTGTQSINTTVATLEIVTDDGTKYMINTTIRPDLNINLSGLPSQVDIDRWPHLCGIDIPDLGIDQVQLLIGQDASDLFIPEEIRKGNTGEPFATLTPLGWALNGPINPVGRQLHDSYFIQSNESLENDLRRMWDIEGVNTEVKGLSANDNKVLDTWNNSLTIEDEHYCFDIPFRSPTPNLLDNRSVAEKKTPISDKTS